MCNACGFLCCADDGMDGCGCDQCPEPACWPDDDDFVEDDGYDDCEFGPIAKPAGLRCHAIEPEAQRHG
jgi:hypothetical protein